MSETRDYNDPRYTALRRAVRKRDGYRCRFPGCKATRNLHVHHVRRFADSPELRHAVGNCITLCVRHHRMVTGKEEEYAGMFLSIISGSDDLSLKLIALRYGLHGNP